MPDWQGLYTMFLNEPIVIPFWAFILLGVFSAWAAFDRLLIPSVRWYIRRKVNRAISEFNIRLRITVRPFHLTKRQVLIDRLVYDSEVLLAMQQYADEKGMPRDVAQAQVVEYAREIVPAFNAYVYFRVGYWISRKFSKLLYRVRVRVFDQKAIEAIDPEATVVFVMNHRSNMDYMLVSYLVARESTLSYAVGEWAQVWPLNVLIRAMGAFFVRRNSGNTLYRRILQRYVHMATKEGVCQAVFLEGGLSHDGKMREPRMGFLNYMLRHYQPDTDRDIVFVPIAINYDRIVEDRNLIRRRNKDEPRPSKWSMIRDGFRFYRKHLAWGTKRRHSRFGYAGVNFGRPISIRDYCASHDTRFDGVSDDERFEATKDLADFLMGEVGFVMPILPVPVLSKVFLDNLDSEFTAFELKSQTMEIVEQLQALGAPIRDHEKPKEATIERGLQMMAHHGMILESNGHFSANPDSVVLLNFYAASLEHWFDDVGVLT
ncbi:MAG: 1-acyl-sn-glycerol-3-phosphate acyltransferase [Candidatus Hydrogenedentota bacterium]